MGEAKPRRRKRRKQSSKWIIVTCVVLLLLGGAGTGIFFLVQNLGGPANDPHKPPPVPSQPQVTVFPKVKARDPLNPSAALRQMIADIDQVDPHWRLEDIEARRATVEDAQNGGIVLYGAARLLPAKWNPEPGKLIPRGELSPLEAYEAGQVDATRKALAEIPVALAAARKLRSYPKGRFRLDYKTNVLDTLMPHLQDLAAIRSVLSYDAQLRAIDGDGEGAMESCLGLLHGCRYAADEPLLISREVRLAVNTVALNTIERVLTSRKGPSDKLLHEVQNRLREEGSRPLFYEMMRGERAAFHYLLTNAANGDAAVPGLQFTSDEHAWYLGYINQAIAAAQEKPGRQQAIKVSEVSTLALDTPRGVKGTIPDVAKIYRSTLPCTARLRAAAAGIAVERFRLKNGRWPNNLNELVPTYLDTLPTDPTEGQVLRFSILPEGVAVYYNHGGNEVKEAQAFVRINQFNDRGDQGFRLLAEKHRR